MSDYGPECTGGTVGAASNSFLGIAIPWIGSLCTSAQVSKGDKFRNDTQALLAKHFDNFHPNTKVEIKNHLRSMEETKKRVKRTWWFIQEQATKYREEAEALFYMVDDLSNRAVTKALLERNNMSYSTIYHPLPFPAVHSVVIDPAAPDAIPLKSISSSTNSARTPAAFVPKDPAAARASAPVPSTSQRSRPNRLDTQAPTVTTLITDQAGLPSRPEAARIRAVATMTAANVNASDESLGLRGLFPTGSRGQETVQ